MADNYLEKRMEEIRSGAGIVRRTAPSLDTLFRKVSGETAIQLNGEKVKQAQLDAAVRSARLLGMTFEAQASEDDQSVTVRFEDSGLYAGPNVGAVILAIRLKAAELNILTKVQSESESGSVKILFFK